MPRHSTCTLVQNKRAGCTWKQAEELQHWHKSMNHRVVVEALDAAAGPMPQLGLLSNPYLLGAIAISGLLQLSVITLPFAQRVFETATHPAWEWELVLLLSLTPVTIVELIKVVRSFRRRLNA